MRLLITGAVAWAAKEIDSMRELGFEVVVLPDESASLPPEAKAVDAVVCNSLFLHHSARQFPRLRFVQLTSVGRDRTPMEDFQKEGIKVATAADVYSTPMAEWVIAQLLQIYKRSRILWNNQSNRIWVKSRDIVELAGRSVCIIGMGNVGAKAMHLLQAFGAQVYPVSRSTPASERCRHLANSDAVVLSLPLTDETRGMVNADFIASMRDESILINVSRGEIVETEALISALDAGKFMGVSLDTFSCEPLDPSSPLWGYERVVVTPHNSFVSDRNYDRLAHLVLENLAREFDLGVSVLQAPPSSERI